MTEAWLLIDETALRTAAGAPGGRQIVNLPPSRELESLADPKTLLGSLFVRRADYRAVDWHV
jgi:hypothetical protein